MNEKKINARINKTINAINTIQKFPQENIIAYVKASNIANKRLPIIPKIQLVIDRSDIPFNNIINVFTNKKADILGGSSEVVNFNEMRPYFYLNLKKFKAKVKKLMPRNKTILVLLNLNKISDFQRYTQSTLLTNLEAIIINIEKTPKLASLLTEATALKNQVENPLSIKQEQFTNIKSDRTKMTTVLGVLKICLRANFGTFLETYADNPEVIFQYFPIEILFKNVKSADTVNKNQKLIVNPETNVFCINDFKISKNGFVKVDCRGKGWMKIWRSFNIVTVAPQGVPMVKANCKDIFANGRLGALNNSYIMCEVEGPLDLVKIMLTSRPKKRGK